MYYNNLGVIHLGMGKPTVACLYLQKALQETQIGEESNSSAHSGTYWAFGQSFESLLCVLKEFHLHRVAEYVVLCMICHSLCKEVISQMCLWQRKRQIPFNLAELLQRCFHTNHCISWAVMCSLSFTTTWVWHCCTWTNLTRPLTSYWRCCRCIPWTHGCGCGLLNAASLYTSW